MLPGFELQRDVLHDRRPAAVAEGDATQLQCAFRRELDGPGALRDSVLGLDEAHDLPERGEPLPEVPEPLAEAGDRVEQLHEVEHVRGDRALRDRAVAVHRGGDEQHGDERDGLGERDHREQADVHEGGAAPGADLGPATRLVRLDRVPLPPERLDHADAREALLQHGQCLGDSVADRVVGAARAVVEGPARRDQDGQGDERDGGEGRRKHDEHAHGEGDLQPAADDLDQRLAQELVERLHVGGEPRDQHACPFLLEEAEGQRLQLVERRRPEPVQKALARRGGQQRLRADDERLRQGQPQDRQSRDVDRVQVMLADPAVDRVPNERGPGEREQRRHDHRRGSAEIQALDRADESARLAPDVAYGRALHQAASLSSASSAR